MKNRKTLLINKYLQSRKWKKEAQLLEETEQTYIKLSKRQQIIDARKLI